MRRPDQRRNGTGLPVASFAATAVPPTANDHHIQRGREWRLPVIARAAEALASELARSKVSDGFLTP